MNIIIDYNNFDINNIFFYDPIKNNIIDDSTFVRIIYSDHNVILNGLYLQITLDKLNDLNNLNTLYNILENIETSILNKYKLNIEKVNRIKVQLVYIIKYIKNNKLILKISGIWENNNKIGLTYKFIY
jgi:hypothetical protein